MPVIVINPAALVFAPSGMNKSAPDYSIGTSYGTVTGWTADTGTYPGSTVSSNGLVVQGGKAGASISGSLRVSNSVAIGNNCTLRLILNGNVGTPLATGSSTPVGALGAATITVSTTVTLGPDDVITLQATASAGGLSGITHAASFMHIT